MHFGTSWRNLSRPTRDIAGQASKAKSMTQITLQKDYCRESVWSNEPARVLYFDEPLIRRIARRRGPKMPIFCLALQAAFREASLRYARRVNFRQTQQPATSAAYAAMDLDDFTAVNARQAWANWRTIPRALSGLLLDQPATVIDLCSGVGQSTEVLACYCPPGSQLLGLELNPAFIAAAQHRAYLDRHEQPARVEFRAQSVLDTFCDAKGRTISRASIDLVHASGAVGSHFDAPATAQLADECARVLRSGGIAALDAGPDGTDRTRMTAIFEARGFELAARAQSCRLDRFEQLCFMRRD